MSATTETVTTTEADRLSIRQVAATYGVPPMTVAGWFAARRVPSARLAYDPVARRRARTMSADDAARLAREYREHMAGVVSRKPKPKRPGGVGLRMCRAGLEPDPIDSLNPIDAVAATLDHDGLVFPAHDRAELARRRELFAARTAA